MSAAPQGNFARLVRGGPSVTQAMPILPGTNNPGVMISKIFQYQSYFDDTFLEKALAIQSSNEPIVGTTLQRQGTPGYCVGLHPSSQTPIAFRPDVGGSGAGQQAVILKPGQIYRPHGKPGEGPGHFSSFRWGLPYGWLGGGMATLFVFPSPDADVAWSGDAEVIFHRTRMKILAPAALPAAAPLNWPLRFPWTQALRGTDSVPQKGQALISITNPTRVVMSLRLASLANASDARVLFQNSNDFDLDSTGAVIATNTRFVDITFGNYAANGGVNVGALPNYPLMELTGPVARLAADDGGMSLVDLSGNLANAYVDCVRYGKL